jgi:hypothetical protein
MVLGVIEFLRLYSLISLVRVRDNTDHILEDTTIDDVLKTFETYYVQKDYAKALGFLESHEKDISPGLWHYNLGTVFAQMNKYPEARYHLLKAQRQGLSNKSVQVNKELVESKLEVAKYERSISTTDHLYRAGMYLSDGILSTLGLLFILAAIWSMRKKSFLTLSGFGLAIATILGLNWWMKSWPLQIVIKPQIIREGPSSIFSEVGELPVGILVIATEKGGWKKIFYPSRYTGWVINDGLKELER